MPIQWIFISFSIGSMRVDKNWTQVKTRRGGCFMSGPVTTHLLAECRCCRRESSWDTWSRGDQDPPRRTRSPGNSSAGPEIGDGIIIKMIVLSHKWPRATPSTHLKFCPSPGYKINGTIELRLNNTVIYNINFEDNKRLPFLPGLGQPEPISAQQNNQQ